MSENIMIPELKEGVQFIEDADLKQHIAETILNDLPD